MDKKDIYRIIEQAKQGDNYAKNQVIKLLQDNGYMKIASKYLYANRLLEPDEAKSEFWMGVVLAMPKVRTDIGDPLFYLAWQGVNNLKSKLRKNIGKGTEYQCTECGYTGRLYHKGNNYVCIKCGSLNIETHQKEINYTTVFKNNTGEDDMPIHETIMPTPPNQLEIDLQIDIQILKDKLTHQELKVFILITEYNINRDHETNYLQAIADRLDITTQCVNRYLNNIREKMIVMLKGR